MAAPVKNVTEKIRNHLTVTMDDELIRLIDRDAVMMKCSKAEIMRDILISWYKEDDDQ